MSNIAPEMNFHSQIVQTPGDSPGICGRFRFFQRLPENMGSLSPSCACLDLPTDLPAPGTLFLEEFQHIWWCRRFDAIVVWKLDRFGRSLVHCVSGIQELASLGIRFIATSQGLDTDESNPASKLLMHILASMAQFERELIRERVSAGIKSARKHGTKTGKANRPASADFRPRRGRAAP